MAATPGPFAAFRGRDLAYALDDGMPFPGWTPSLLSDEEAQVGYEAGERMAVIAGDPADPAAGLVLDRRNGRLAVRRAEPPLQLVYTGAELALAEALWCDGAGRQCWARRVSPVQLRVARRAPDAVVWVEEFLAYAAAEPDERVSWPEFGDWAALDTDPATPWVGERSLELIDADGWLLDALESVGVPSRWRDLGRKYDAPRAFGLPPEVQVKLAEPLGWRPAGRRWRKAAEVDINGLGSVVVVTDAMFAAGAGASGEIVTTVTAGDVHVAIDLPSVTARAEMRRGDRPGSPSHPRPSTGAQVAVTAILDVGGLAHEAVVRAVREGALPSQWLSAFGGDA